MNNLIIDNIKSKHPIIQGGMGIGVSLHKLAIGAIKAGIVGTISSAQVGYLSKNHKTENLKANLEALSKEIALVRKECPDGILGVNVMHALTSFDEYIKHLAKEPINFIVSGAGIPLDLPTYLVGSKVKPAVIISSARAFKLICKKWIIKYDVLPDFVVVEGPLAGGHLGFSKSEIESGNYKSLEEITAEVIEINKEIAEKYGRPHIPIIPAGGIHTAEDVARMMSLGADGVQVATRFICTDECDVNENYKQKLIAAKKDDVIHVSSPVGLPGRAIRNDFTEYLKTGNHKIKFCVNCLRVCAKKDIPYCITERLGAAAKGDVENGLVFSGANSYKITKIDSVKNIVEDLVSKIK